MSDRIAVLSEGRVLQVDDPERLYEAPRSRFVADFIGTMNFFDGTVREIRDGVASISAGPLGTVRAVCQGSKVGVGVAVTVALRPERLKLVFAEPDAADNAVEGRMGPAAYLGDRSYFYVHIRNRDEPVAVAATSSARRYARSEPINRFG